MKPAVVLLARAPSAKGKTRLTGHLPADRAHALRAALLLDTLDVARAVALPLFVSYTPQDARDEMTRLVPDARLVCQEGDSLGERMRHAMDHAFATGATPVVLIGSDLPSLPVTYLRAAVEQLTAVRADDSSPQPDIVLGPSEDGGFYLIGARHSTPGVFDGIHWGGPHVLDAVVAAARARGFVIGFTPEWWDVDRPEDLNRVLTRRDASVRGAAGDAANARRVREFLGRDS